MVTGVVLPSSITLPEACAKPASGQARPASLLISVTVFLPATGVKLLIAPPAPRAAASVMLSVAPPYWPVQRPAAVMPTLNLLTKACREAMFGSVPVKPSYVRCHGSVLGEVVPLYLSTPLKVEPLPLVQVSCFAIAFVTAPARFLATLAMVLEWKDPSSVTLHLTVTTPGTLNSRLVNVSLRFWLLVESLVADALLTALASSRAAATAASESFADLRMWLTFRMEPENS